MLSPRQLDGLSDEIVEIYSQLETDILRDMARRLARLGKVTEATEWQARVLAEAGGLKKNVGRILARYDRAIVRQIKDTLTEAMETSARNDNRIFKAATGRTVSAPNAQAMLSTIQKCHSDLSRLTLTTAATTQTQFVQEANRVYMMTQSGAFDYDTAMMDAADALAKRGITTVRYENGRPVTLTIEAAVRMNILTSINQTAANQTLSNAEEMGADKFEVTAHIGSRPEHEEWQGKVWTKDQLYSVCGLGEVDGLCGINCRHSFYPYFEGTERHYTQDDLDEMAGERVTYTDKDGNTRTMTRYEAEQRERQIERNIRRYKRLALTEEAAGADSTRARRKLGEWQAAARDFTAQTGIARDSAREHVGTGGSQPRGITPRTEAAENSSATAAKKMFPKEEWEEKSSGVFVAKSRMPKTKQQADVFKKEYDMALIAQKYGHTVYMLPETGTGKNPDTIMDGVKTEFKNITGGLNAIGKRLHEAMKQGENVYLKIDSDIDVRDIYKKIRGEVIHSDYQTGFVYVYVSGKMYKWNIGKMR